MLQLVGQGNVLDRPNPGIAPVHVSYDNTLVKLSNGSKAVSGPRASDLSLGKCPGRRVAGRSGEGKMLKAAMLARGPSTVGYADATSDTVPYVHSALCLQFLNEKLSLGKTMLSIVVTEEDSAPDLSALVSSIMGFAVNCSKVGALAYRPAGGAKGSVWSM